MVFGLNHTPILTQAIQPFTADRRIHGSLSGGLNQEGIDHYNNLITEVTNNGIRPFVTLLHFDLPQILQDKYGGFLSRKIVFLHPLVYGEYPRSMRNLVKGRLPAFNGKDRLLVKGSFDFIGFNYYTSRYAKAAGMNPDVPPMSFSFDSFVDFSITRDGVPIGKKGPGNGFIYIYPEGLMKLLYYTKRKYKNPRIYITENGIYDAKSDGKTIQEALQDQHRSSFILKHLYQINRSIRKGVEVKGYFYWSLFDSFEFEEGRQVRYGLYYIDYGNNFTRIPKHSAEWLPSFLRNKERAQAL
ncbi:hypothetical protein SAY86_006596 [Trapa natans]|uniref:Beta-glucosidase n=1 Tax=Trapa natans TaxID=22666 RepID=A0AAN7KZ48_TRANT|nr:hypothetical protein SAY86_006596 [Trapa natans]